MGHTISYCLPVFWYFIKSSRFIEDFSYHSNTTGSPDIGISIGNSSSPGTLPFFISFKTLVISSILKFCIAISYSCYCPASFSSYLTSTFNKSKYSIHLCYFLWFKYEVFVLIIHSVCNILISFLVIFCYAVQ